MSEPSAERLPLTDAEFPHKQRQCNGRPQRRGDFAKGVEWMECPDCGAVAGRRAMSGRPDA